MRITAVRSLDFSNSNYRSYFPLLELAKRGHDIAINAAGAPRFSLKQLFTSDVVHVHRFGDDEMLRVFQQLRARGIGIVWDDDDDLSAIPKESPLYKKMGGVHRERALRTLRQILGSVDTVTTPSSVLAEKFRSFGASRVQVLENYPPYDIRVRRSGRREFVTVGWVAGLEHQYDAQKLGLKALFERLLAEHPELRVVCVGLSLGLASDRYEHIPRVHFDHLPSVIAHFDIGIAPLADSTFNRSRSNIKVKEYAATGVPWLASDAIAYAGLGEAQGGRLVDDRSWHRELARLIVDVKGRQKLAKKAEKWAKTQVIARHATKWENVFLDTHTRARGRSVHA